MIEKAAVVVSMQVARLVRIAGHLTDITVGTIIRRESADSPLKKGTKPAYRETNSTLYYGTQIIQINPVLTVERSVTSEDSDAL